MDKAIPGNGSVEVTVAKEKVEEIKLPSGKIAKMIEFKGKHIREAQRLANGDAGQLIFAIIAITTTIDGAAVLMEDMDEMAGLDCLELMNRFGSGFTSAPNK